MILTTFVEARSLSRIRSFDKPTSIVITIIKKAIASEYTKKIRMAFPKAPESIALRTMPNKMGPLQATEARA